MADPFRAALLLSMPQLQDPNFAKTVVLLCDYGPEGAFGLVLNRPTDMPASTMVRLEPPITGGNDLPLWIGGPVEPERGWILLGDEPPEDFKFIRDGLFLSTSQVLLREVLEASPGSSGIPLAALRTYPRPSTRSTSARPGLPAGWWLQSRRTSTAAATEPTIAPP
jgi:putative transcriptional regulator